MSLTGSLTDRWRFALRSEKWYSGGGSTRRQKPDCANERSLGTNVTYVSVSRIRPKSNGGSACRSVKRLREGHFGSGLIQFGFESFFLDEEDAKHLFCEIRSSTNDSHVENDYPD